MCKVGSTWFLGYFLGLYGNRQEYSISGFDHKSSKSFLSRGIWRSLVYPCWTTSSGSEVSLRSGNYRRYHIYSRNLYHPLFAGTQYTLPVKPPYFLKQYIAACITLPEDLSVSTKRSLAAAAAKIDRTAIHHKVLDEFIITQKDMAMICPSPDPWHKAFEEELDLNESQVI